MSGHLSWMRSFIGLTYLRRTFSRIRLLQKARDQPRAGRAGRVIGAVDCIELINTSLRVGKVEMNEAPGVQIVLHHRDRHVSPSDAFLEKHVLGPEIGKLPSLWADHSEVQPGGQRRAICEHELRMAATYSRLICPTRSQWMAWRGHGNQPD